jgi:hypothetical protein
MKHVELDYNFVRDRVLRKLLDVWFISTSDQVDLQLKKDVRLPLSLEFCCHV